MVLAFEKFIFSLYEQPRLRKWFYTLAFAIFVPTGFRFATLAWEFGDWFDKPLSIIAGIVIGITALVTLLRFWKVPPRKTLNSGAAVKTESVPVPPMPGAAEILAAVKGQAAQNRRIARDAAALGSTRGWHW